MKTLVTGGAGFIGSHLVEALLARGDDVCALDNLSSGRKRNLLAIRRHPLFRLEVGDVRDAGRTRELVAEADVIYHLAAHVGVRRIVGQALECLLNNLQGTMVLLEEAARAGKRTMVFSSSEVYGRGKGEPLTEEEDLGFGAPNVLRWSYAAGKAADEALALAYHAERGLPVTVVRCFNTCGPRQSDRYGMVVPTFVRQALADAPLTVHGDGQQRRCFSYVGDVVRGVIMLEQSRAAVGEVFNVGNDEEVSILDLAHRVIRTTGSRSSVSLVSYEHAFGGAFEDIRRRIPSLEKIRTYVGYEPRVSLDGILEMTIASQWPDSTQRPDQVRRSAPSQRPDRALRPDPTQGSGGSGQARTSESTWHDCAEATDSAPDRCTG